MLLPVIAAAQSRPSRASGRDLRGDGSRNAGGARATPALGHDGGSPPKPPGPAGIVQRLFALAAAALVLVGSLTAGRSYLWCSMMERAVEACCCDVEHAEGESPADEGSEIKNACCEDRALGDLDKARVAADALELPDAAPAALPAPTVIVAAAIPAARFVPARAPSSICPSPIRAGPRSAAENAIRLQVFLC